MLFVQFCFNWNICIYESVIDFKIGRKEVFTHIPLFKELMLNNEDRIIINIILDDIYLCSNSVLLN